jgi:ABC-type antimicrobial peptide transport system permease subunit
MCALTLFLDQHKREITVMRTVGASQRKIKTDLLIKLLFLSLAASLLGASLATGILTVLGNGGYLQVLSHGICFTFNPSVFVANFVLIGLLVAVGVTRWSGKP